jgi:hypothetical protein
MDGDEPACTGGEELEVRQSPLAARSVGDDVSEPVNHPLAIQVEGRADGVTGIGTALGGDVDWVAERFGVVASRCLVVAGW